MSGQEELEQVKIKQPRFKVPSRYELETAYLALKKEIRHLKKLVKEGFFEAHLRGIDIGSSFGGETDEESWEKSKTKKKLEKIK